MDKAGAYGIQGFGAALVSAATASQEGFHPSDEGYQLIADRFANAMRANGIPLKA